MGENPDAAATSAIVTAPALGRGDREFISVPRSVKKLKRTKLDAHVRQSIWAIRCRLQHGR
jgi:hypothetical protein